MEQIWQAPVKMDSRSRTGNENSFFFTGQSDEYLKSRSAAGLDGELCCNWIQTAPTQRLDGGRRLIWYLGDFFFFFFSFFFFFLFFFSFFLAKKCFFFWVPSPSSNHCHMSAWAVVSLWMSWAWILYFFAAHRLQRLWGYAHNILLLECCVDIGTVDVFWSSWELMERGNRGIRDFGSPVLTIFRERDDADLIHIRIGILGQEMVFVFVVFAEILCGKHSRRLGRLWSFFGFSINYFFPPLKKRYENLRLFCCFVVISNWDALHNSYATRFLA